MASSRWKAISTVFLVCARSFDSRTVTDPPAVDIRLFEINQEFLNPPRVPTPEPAPEAETPTAPADIEISIGGLPPSLGTASSLKFVVEDELEAEPEPQPALDQSTEWVHVNEPEVQP